MTTTMPLNKKIVLLCLLAITAIACKKDDKQPDEPTIDSHPELVAACQHIEGGGAAVTGGDGGAVYRVSRLDDELNPNTGLPMNGTLRYAVSQLGARRVIFSVSGTIHLKSELRIKNHNLTIDGQSAPGDGICIADYPLIINANNVIVRFLRVRLGDESLKEFDAVSVNDAQGVVLDHLSCSWSVDECVSCYGNTDFTMQYCIVSESLKNSVHGKGNHGYGGIWGGTNASFHHNLLAHHDSRNPRFDHDYVDTKCAGPIDFVNNYYKPGPATKSGVKTRLVGPTTKCGNCANKPGGTVEPGKFYLTGNIMDGSTDVTNNNWNGVFPDDASKKDLCKADNRWTAGLTPLKNEQRADEAYETVLAKAGCSHVRDAVDTRIISEVREGKYTYQGSNGSKNGLIDSHTDVGGWPELKEGTAPADSDYDGMPDEWEEKYGLNPKDASDAKQKTLVTGHTNLDVYMCHKVSHLY